MGVGEGRSGLELQLHALIKPANFQIRLAWQPRHPRAKRPALRAHRPAASASCPMFPATALENCEPACLNVSTAAVQGPEAKASRRLCAS